MILRQGRDVRSRPVLPPGKNYSDSGLQRRRAASWRCEPLGDGRRDPLDPTRRATRARTHAFTYCDVDGNTRNERGQILRSKLDLLLDGDDQADVVVPAQRTTPSEQAGRCGRRAA